MEEWVIGALIMLVLCVLVGMAVVIPESGCTALLFLVVAFFVWITGAAS